MGMAIGSIYRPLLEVLREYGADVDGALSLLGLSYEEVVEGQWLSPEQGRRLMRLCGPVRPEEPLGLLAAKRFREADADLVGYLMRHSATPLDAVGALQEHAKLLGDSAVVAIARADSAVTVTFGRDGGRHMLPEGADFAAGVIHRILTEASRKVAKPTSVRIPRPRPRSVAPYRRFFSAPVSFGGQHVSLTYSDEVMRVPLQQRDRRLSRILQQHATGLASIAPTADFPSRIRARIAQDLETGPRDPASVAKRCGISERTLRRRLADAGTTYRALLDDVREEHALSWLSEGQPVTRVAQRLGFSDATSFARAFRRWTGRLPHSFLSRSR